MKTSNFLTHLLVAAISFAAVSGCKKTPTSPTPIFGHNNRPPSDTSLGGPESPGPILPANPETKGSSLTDGGANRDPNALGPREAMGDYFLDREAFKQQTIYFDFDRHNVKASELPKAQSVVSYLKNQPDFKVLVEGHCDERGTPEYNRALGERRALSIREALMHLGLSGDKIQTISYGEDKPADPGHDATAWAKNRRGEFVLMKPKSGGAAPAGTQ